MKIFYRLILIALALTSLSCGIFKPRESNDPENPVPWVSYAIKKEQVLENLIYSYNFPENIFKYSEIFTPDFTFSFATQDISEHGTPVELNVEQEAEMLVNLQKYLGSVGSKIKLDSLVTIENQADQINSNSATLYRRYYLSLEGRTTKIYQGKAEFYLIQNAETSLWRIQQWKDYRTISNQTWGLLKNEYTL